MEENTDIYRFRADEQHEYIYIAVERKIATDQSGVETEQKQK